MTAGRNTTGMNRPDILCVVLQPTALELTRLYNKAYLTSVIRCVDPAQPRVLSAFKTPSLAVDEFL